MDKLPVDWKTEALRKAVTVDKSALEPRSAPNEEFEYYSIPAYQQSLRPALEVGAHIRSVKLLVKPGTVLFGKLNPRVPKIWLVPKGSARRKIASTEFIPLSPLGQVIDPDFLYYLCWSEYILPPAQALVSGSTPSRQRVDVPSFLDMKAPIPPLPEQRAIVHVLRTVQQAMEATEKAIAATKQLKQSLLRHLFTYGSLPVSMAEQVDLRETPYGVVPKLWKGFSLGECAHVQTGIAKGRKISGIECIDVPYLRVANVQDGYLDLTEMKTITIKQSEMNRFSLQLGDVVLTEGGDFDKLGRGFVWNAEVPNCVHQNHIFAVRTNRDLLEGEFLSYLTQSPYGKKYFLSVAHKTTNLACINTAKLKAFPIPIPPIQEQNRIVEQLQQVDRKAQAEAQLKASQDVLFRSLLHFLMTGKVRVQHLGVAEAAGSP